MGPRCYCDRALAPILHNTSGVYQCKVDCPIRSAQVFSLRRRNRRLAAKRRHRGGQPSLSRVLQHVFCSTQERRRFSANSKLEASKQVHQISKVQDGNTCNDFEVPSPGRLVSQHRLNRCIPSHSDPPISSSLSQIRIQERCIPVQGVTIRSHVGSKSVHSGFGPLSGYFPFHGNSIPSLSGRLSLGRSVSFNSGAQHRKGSEGSSSGRVLSQPLQVPSHSVSGSGIFGASVSDGPRHCPPAIRKSPSRDSVRRRLFQESVSDSTSLSQTLGVNGVLSSGGSFSSSKNETASNFPLRQMEFEKNASLLSSGYSRLSTSVSPTLETNRLANGGSTDCNIQSNSNDSNRCLDTRLGRSFNDQASSAHSTEALEFSRENNAHKLFGDVGSSQNASGLPLTPSRALNLGLNGQHVRETIHQQERRNKISQSLCSNSKTIRMVRKVSDSITGTTCARSRQRPRRQVVKTFPIRYGVATPSFCRRGPLSPMGLSKYRLIRYRTKQTLSSIRLMEARGKRVSCRRSNVRLARSIRLRLPSDSNPSNGSQEGSPGPSRVDSNHSLLAEPTLVHSASPYVDRPSDQATSVNESVNAERRQVSPSKPGSLVPGSLENKREHLQGEGLSQAVAKTILAARSKATYKKYEAGWNHYARWCRDHSVHTFTSSVPDVLQYLQYCLDTLNLSVSLVRSRIYAIALYHKRYPLAQLSQHTWVQQFIKGMQREYVVPKSVLPQWKLQWVLQGLRGAPFEPMTSQRLDLLTYKTAFLLAITSAKRIGELHALSSNKRLLHITPAGIRLRLNPAFIPKVNNPKNREQELFFTPFCPQTNPPTGQTYYRLCVRRAVYKYLKATEPFRLDEQLFVCFHGQRKGRAATKASIARWVKKGIEHAYKAINKPLPSGIKAHQTRGMAASWAQFHNTSVRDICDTASWGDVSTFARHYQLNLAGNEPSARFGNAVLQTVLDGRPQ